VELDLGLRGQLAELVGPERIEWRARGEKPCDLAQCRVQRKPLDVALDMSRRTD
jgi:hypothetical protein